MRRKSRRELLRVLGVAATSGLAGCPTFDGGPRPDDGNAGEWPTFQHDAANTGYVPDELGPAGTITERWRFEAGIAVWSSPAVVDDVAYVGGLDGSICALDAEDGAQRWCFDAAGPAVASSPTVADGLVFVGGGENTPDCPIGTLHALAADDGTEQWRFEDGNYFRSAPAVVEGNVFVGSGDGRVYALSTADGTVEWRFETGHDQATPPAVNGGTLYVAGASSTSDGTVGTAFALDANDGTERWRFETSGRLIGIPTVTDGTVYVTSLRDAIHALDAGDGTERWRYDTGGRLAVSPAVAQDTLYVGSPNESDGRDYIYALDAADGTQRWISGFERTYDVDSPVFPSSPAVVGNTLYVGFGIESLESVGTLYALEAGDGTEQWRFERGNFFSSSPAVVDGNVFVGSGDGYVYALAEGDGS